MPCRGVPWASCQEATLLVRAVRMEMEAVAAEGCSGAETSVFAAAIRLGGRPHLFPDTPGDLVDDSRSALSVAACHDPRPSGAGTIGNFGGSPTMCRPPSSGHAIGRDRQSGAARRQEEQRDRHSPRPSTRGVLPTRKRGRANPGNRPKVVPAAIARRRTDTLAFSYSAVRR